MTANLEKIQEQLSEIQKRNKRVEADKAWETSKTRKGTIAVLTYLVIVLFFYAAHLSKPWINSIAPTIGFILSTVSFPYFKRVWLNNQKHYK